MHAVSVTIRYATKCCLISINKVSAHIFALLSPLSVGDSLKQMRPMVRICLNVESTSTDGHGNGGGGDGDGQCPEAHIVSFSSHHHPVRLSCNHCPVSCSLHRLLTGGDTIASVERQSHTHRLTVRKTALAPLPKSAHCTVAHFATLRPLTL